MNLLDMRIREYLNSHIPDGPVIIWGGGQLGHATYNLISQEFKAIELLGFIDSSVTQETEKDGISFYPPVSLDGLNPALIIVASIAFEAEIVQTIHRQFKHYANSVFCLSGPSELREKLAFLVPNQDIDGILTLVFDYPDCSLVWQAMAQLSSDTSQKALYQDCAAKLSDNCSVQAN